MLTQDVTIDAALEPHNVLHEVVVTSSRKPSIQQRTQMSSVDLPIEMIESLPRFLGENGHHKSHTITARRTGR